MIGYDEVIGYGRVLRAHGKDGEVVIPVPYSLIHSSGLPFLVLDMDGILVPFAIESVRDRGSSSSIVRLDGVDSLERADTFRGKSIWLLRRYLDNIGEDEMTPAMLVGMDVRNQSDGSILGAVKAVDDSTINVLLVVETKDGKEILIPACDEFVKKIDMRKGIVRVVIPEGLAEL